MIKEDAIERWRKYLSVIEPLMKEVDKEVNNGDFSSVINNAELCLLAELRYIHALLQITIQNMSKETNRSKERSIEQE